jgi:hypothetical protein
LVGNPKQWYQLEAIPLLKVVTSAAIYCQGNRVTAVPSLLLRLEAIAAIVAIVVFAAISFL